jgi:4-hydroxybenzoate polyprenyltransferase
MNRRSLLGIWKANGPQWVWTGFPVWIGAIFAGLGRAPTLSEWGPICLFLVTVAALIATCSQFSNIYADRYEDRIYVPSSPLVTGELEAGTAKKALILQNILCGLLLIALLVVTLNYWLIIALIFGWALGLTYNLPPFRFKETAINPFHFGLGMALALIVAWLAVSPLNRFIIAFAAFFFLHFVAFGTTN